MTIRVALHHRTTYEYDRPVKLGPQVVRLRPAPHARTPIPSYSLTVTPGEHYLNWQQDPFGNFNARLVFPEKARKFEVVVDLHADMTVINPFDFFVEPDAEELPLEYEPALAKELAPYLELSKRERSFRRFLDALPKREGRTVDYLIELNRRVYDHVEYLIRMEPGVQTPEKTLEVAKGSCRDSSWLLVNLLRELGFAARFVSGYLIQLKPDQKSLDGPSGAAEDFTDLHAWCEVFVPGAGWIGLDPTSGLLTGEGHIPLAATPSPTGAAPITGAVDEAEVEFDFDMTLTRIHEDPRVTKPYTPEEWRRIEALGHEIDARLDEDDVRLTMGGEPTFVSIDDMEGAEWTTGAVGLDKRRKSAELVHRLRDRFAPGALLHFGQGKWYPGEPLPRWADACYWRRDGEPVWTDPALFASVGSKTNDSREPDSPTHDEKDAARFIERLAALLGISEEFTVPAYEDAMYAAWKENRLPPNVTAGSAKADDLGERKRLAKFFERGLDRPTGYVLPIREPGFLGRGTDWVTGPWVVRSEHMFLLPGDSPMGLRLPLDSLSEIPEGQIPAPAPHDPSAPRGPLPKPVVQAYLTKHGLQTSNRRALEAVTVPGGGSGPSVAASGDSRSGFPDDPFEDRTPPILTERPAEVIDDPGIVRTALCVEPRDGRLHVFMPPVDRLEPYLELVGAIELTARTLDLPVVVEGYPPPHDPRLLNLKVTPDPGVIEVNIHPAGSWEELHDTTTTLYEEAREARLGTEKFDLDGKHTGTGGGNHIVLGAERPTDSPFLRRPDLLSSLIRYWVNHPSLSYLFSSRFIGPTSQAPRVDEGRPDALHELDLALQILDREEKNTPPWLVDRVFRDLLTDLTGNTHRAEICIDKLFSPDSSTGRLGLVELRGFEMPPHAEMSLTQQLLIRALVARFWRDPVRTRPVEWGTTLHDKFMLPRFIEEDFRDIIDDVREHGIALEFDWFAPHFEFRFPRIGEFVQRAVQVELRHAIEPWYVLGEEPAGGGTARSVDSSVERMQVLVQNLTEGRHTVLCNGRPVPLHPTGTAGEMVAGVRYRAWQPPHCLHPTVPVQTPLVVELVDDWQQRSLGGCTYHVSNPTGRNPEHFPVNALEAESRRAARFFTQGLSGGAIDPPSEVQNRRFPMTLDLRQPPLERR